MNTDIETTAQVEFHVTSAPAGAACDHCGERIEWGADMTVAEVRIGNFTSEFQFHGGECEEAANEGFQF